MTDGPSGRILLLGSDDRGAAADRLVAAIRPRSVTDGWATVELDRAVEELTEIRVGSARPTVTTLPDDRHLGARCRLLAFDDGAAIVILEPAREGRLAAALARHGEGFVARYLIAGEGAVERARVAGFSLSSEATGPFGRSQFVTGPVSGPFLVIAGFD